MKLKDNLTNGLKTEAADEISHALSPLLADVLALYIKTKNFHWHMSGSHFRDYHLLLDEQAEQLFAITDEIAERARKLGAMTIRSIGDIARQQRLKDCDQDHLSANEMLQELWSDNRQLAGFLHATHDVCEQQRDVATASLIENWIDRQNAAFGFWQRPCLTIPKRKQKRGRPDEPLQNPIVHGCSGWLVPSGDSRRSSVGP